MNIPEFKTNSLSSPARGKSLVAPYKVLPQCGVDRFQVSKFQVSKFQGFKISR